MFSHIKELFTRPSGYNIARSVRLRSSASAYFNRTPASAGNRQKFTWSGWVKRGTLGTTQTLFAAGSAGTAGDPIFVWQFSGDKLQADYYNGTNDYYVRTNAVYRDPSAWYHIMLVVDSTDATSSNRYKYYVNGQQITSMEVSNYPSQNLNFPINNTQAQYLCRAGDGTQYFDGYLAEINFIDGQALTPSSFGLTNALTGVWQPAKYTGTYGTNGFYLNFSSNGTSAALGTDFSGNSNTWTVNNISVTAGSTYDSMTDVPTLTSATASNYATLNPLTQTTYGSLSNGNLLFTGATDWGGSKSTFAMPTTGKWYAEFTLGSTSSNSAQADIGIFPAGNSNYYSWTGSYGFEMNNGFFLITNGSYSSNRGGTTAGGTVLQIAVDADAGKVWFGVANAWYDTYNTTNGNPSSGTNPSASSLNFSTTQFFMGVKTDTNNWTANFGQRPFTYTPPSGYVALNTYNLPTSTITNGATYMNAILQSGSAVNTGANLFAQSGFTYGMVWGKDRTSVNNHQLVDTVRGTSNVLQSNTTSAETTYTAPTSGDSCVAWGWNASNASSSNTNGSITSTVSVGATQGFSVVTYTGNGANATVGHGLGVAPNMVIVKARNYGSATDWAVYHSGLTSAAYAVFLDTTGAQSNAASWWNSTAPTSTVFSIGTSGPAINGSGTNYVAYCFAAVKGFSAFGSYTGNGSSDGPFVYCGFRPRFVMIKRTDAVNNWVIYDTARDTFNKTSKYLYAQSSQAEVDDTVDYIDILSNGFKPRATWGGLNASGGTYIYMTFAENPFRNALAR